MGKRKKEISKELIINTTLQLIEKTGGIKDVNLRGIAKEIGCAHTNLYNYFSNFDEIIWESLGYILLKMINYVDLKSVSTDNDEDKLYSVLEAILKFSLMHPGWYRLIWLETIEGEPSPQIAEILIRPTEGLNTLIIKASGGTVTDEKANKIANILYSYLHGEVCKWINGRMPTSSKDDIITITMSNLKLLYKLLVNDSL